MVCGRLTLCGFISREEIAQGALSQLGETAMPLRRTMLTPMVGEKVRRPQFRADNRARWPYSRPAPQSRP
jgi:hypothetical protein